MPEGNQVLDFDYNIIQAPLVHSALLYVFVAIIKKVVLLFRQILKLHFSILIRFKPILPQITFVENEMPVIVNQGSRDLIQLVTLALVSFHPFPKTVSGVIRPTTDSSAVSALA